MIKKFLNKKIIIFGTSVEGMFTLDILKNYNITPLCYIDNHKQKINTMYNNIIIKPVDYLYELKNDEYITITINGVLQVSINRNDNFVYNVDLYSIQNDEVIGDTYVTDEDVLSEEEFERVHPD